MQTSDLKWLEEIEQRNDHRVLGPSEDPCFSYGECQLNQIPIDKLTKALRVAMAALEKGTITLANCDEHCLSATRANSDAVKALAEIERLGGDDE